MPESKVIIEYYTDILCVWAWIAQRRLEEIENEFGDKVEIRYHYLDIFGDTAGKMEKQWAAKGGYEAFGSHVLHSAAPFPDAPVHKEIWRKSRPASSANPHLYLKAVEIAYSSQTAKDMALALRKVFFEEAEDISDKSVLDATAEVLSLDPENIKQFLLNGQAMAALMQDYQHAKQQCLKGSPTYILDGGRQILFGNVGYRVIQANIEELLKKPAEEASWC